MENWMSPPEWLESLDAPSRAKADRLIAILEQFGAHDPVSWVQSEMNENIPQVARFLFLHEIRSELISKFTYNRGLTVAGGEKAPPSPHEITTQASEAYERLTGAGADPKDLERIAHAATYDAVYEFLCLLDHVYPSVTEEIDDVPQWFLGEVADSSGEGRWTGRLLDGLHESFGSLYPSDEDSQ